jgi:hypothetical protein
MRVNKEQIKWSMLTSIMQKVEIRERDRNQSYVIPCDDQCRYAGSIIVCKIGAVHMCGRYIWQSGLDDNDGRYE